MLDFPNPPLTVGQVWNNWTWDGTKWTASTPAPPLVSIGTVAPTSPAVGDFWWDSTGGNLYVYYNDGSSSQWVPSTNVAGPPGAQGVPGPTAVSADANNLARLGSDSLLYVPTDMRSLLINGNIDVDQRGSHGAAITVPGGALTFPADRFWGYASQAGKLNVDSSQLLQLADGCGHVMRASVLAAVASMATSDAFQFGYRIEGLDAKRLLWGTVNAKPLTVSFWAAASATGAYGFAAYNGNGSTPRAYVTSFNLTANIWTKITITVPGDTSGTWATDNTLGLQINWTFAAGSQYIGTANAWQSAVALVPPGIINAMATQGNVALEIARVQAEVGSVATPFEEVPIGLTTMLCQRYYQRYVNQANRPYVTGYANGAGAIGNLENLLLPVVMRATPTVTQIGAWALGNCTSIAWTATVNSVDMYATATATGITSFYPPSGSPGQGYDLNAEL
jgi:hypothetical protein